MSLKHLSNMGIKVPRECGECSALSCLDGQIGDINRVSALGANPTAFGKAALLGNGASRDGVPAHVLDSVERAAAKGQRRQEELGKLAVEVINWCGQDVGPPDAAARESYVAGPLESVAGMTFESCHSKHPVAPVPVGAGTATAVGC